ncbi:MAG TPA: hypothetical protein ENJ84_08295 [Gammaproteobacteria bacterium]|nr:hypothetical protein [Gammaproteobacteria bacterium]
MRRLITSLSDDLIEIQLNEKEGLQILFPLLQDFGMTNAIHTLPETIRNSPRCLKALGFFLDENSEYWIAENGQQPANVCVKRIGRFSQLIEQWRSPDIDAILSSPAYTALEEAIETYRPELKFDKSGVYQRLFSQAKKLAEALHEETIEDSSAFIEALSTICRQFWHSTVEVCEFNPERHGGILPPSLQESKNLNLTAIQDPKVIWISYKTEVLSQWETALTYQQFKENCTELAVCSRNALF